MTDDTQDEFTVVSDNAEATMEVMELLADRDDITVKNRKDGDSSSSVKVESDSLSNGGEPPNSFLEEVCRIAGQGLAEDKEAATAIVEIRNLTTNNSDSTSKDSGKSCDSSSKEPPTAAEVVGHWNDPQKTKTTVYGAHNLEKGDELVRRVDHEERVQELNARWAQRMEDAVKNERERFKTVIDEKICFYEQLDRNLSDVEYGRFKELRKLRQELSLLDMENQSQDSFREN